MEESLALQVVRAFIAKINAHAVDGLSTLMTDHHRCVDALGVTGHGREAVRQAWQAFFTSVPDYAIACKQMISEGQTIAIFGTVSGTYHHDGAQHAARRWEGPAAWKAVVSGTRVAEWQVYYAAPPAWLSTDEQDG